MSSQAADDGVSSSRLFIRQLPKHLTEARLREHFATLGVVTDVKILRTRDGRSRQIGFVGYKDAASAAHAAKHLNKTYLDTSRILVEPAKRVHDPTLVRPWSKYSKGSSRHQRSQPEEYKVEVVKRAGKGGEGKGKAALSEKELKRQQKREKKAAKKAAKDAKKAAKEAKKAGKEAKKAKKAKKSAAGKADSGDKATKDGAGEGDDDVRYQEFLKVMQSRRQGAFWANDDITSVGKDTAAAAGAGAASDGSGTDSDEYEDVGTGGGKSDAGSDSDSDSDSDAASRPHKKKRGNDVKPVSDLDFLKSKVVSNLSDSEDEGGNGTGAAASASASDSDDSDDDSSDDSSSDSSDDSSSSDDSEGEGVEDHGRLFVRNLAFATTEDDMRSAFEKYGHLSEVTIVRDDLGRSKGFGFVQFLIPERAVAAMAALDGTFFQGRLLHVIPGRPSRNKAASGGDGEQSGKVEKGYKAKKEAERKEAAGKEESVWHSLFIRSDTAVQALAEKFGLKQGDIMDKDAGNMAVRAALAETHVIKETKDFLETEGVSLDALEHAVRGNKVKRSKTVLLVKNLPYTTQEADLRELFSRSGTLLRLVLAPTRSVALVEFAEARNAERAFKALAYTRFQRVPLYLEWAPAQVFSRPAPGAAPAAADSAQANGDGAGAGAGAAAAATAPATDGATAASGAGGGEVEGTEEDRKTVFVKNLAWETTEDALQELFSQVGDVRAVKIPTKRDPRRPGEVLSMGFGFVEFATEKGATTAMKRLQGTMLDEHSLQLRLSQRKVDSTGVKRKRTAMEAGSGKSAKLMVKNLAFEATRKDVRELFGSYGRLKSVRLPRKFDGTNRGFAFVEFASRQEAKAATTALSSSHLYGRHIVIEWAEDKEDLDTLRAKAGRNIQAQRQQ